MLLYVFVFWCLTIWLGFNCVLLIVFVFIYSDDKNRVMLDSTEPDGHTDYVNASYIEVRVIIVLDINKPISLIHIQLS